MYIVFLEELVLAYKLDKHYIHPCPYQKLPIPIKLSISHALKIIPVSQTLINIHSSITILRNQTHPPLPLNSIWIISVILMETSYQMEELFHQVVMKSVMYLRVVVLPEPEWPLFKDLAQPTQQPRLTVMCCEFNWSTQHSILILSKKECLTKFNSHFQIVRSHLS